MQNFYLPPEQQWENLTLANDFLFGKIMHDKKLCTHLIRLILPDMDIGRIEFTQIQKTSQHTWDTRGVRFDGFSASDDRKLFACEMQTSHKKDLPRRTKAYHINMGLEATSKENLKKSGSYNDLPDTFVIFICTFDPFGEDRHIYTFYNMCKENPSLRLDDGTVTVFLNAKGTADDVSPELKAFLDLVMGKSSDDSFVRELEERLYEAKQNARWKEMYMFSMLHEWEKFNEGKAEGIIEGRAEGRAVGLAEGKVIGDEQARRSVLQNLLNMGMRLEDALKATGLNFS